MKTLLLFCILSVSFTSTFFSQEKNNLNAEEKAYLFHIVRKSPILEKNIGRYFEYKGPEINFASGEPNYDSIESIIINNPSYLFIRTTEIAKSPKGLIAEAANKMAIWELNKILLAVRQDDKESIQLYKTKLEQFESILTPLLPKAAKKETNKIEYPHKRIYQILDPGLSLNEKTALIGTYHFLDLNDQLTTLDAINKAINKYVENRTYFIYKALGGEAVAFSNLLVAAGDGSNTSGLLEEREKDEFGRWNLGLPKAVGLFPYQLEMISDEKKVNTIEPKRFTSNHFKTVGNNKITNLHFDVWGYNSKKQTTVVIEKNGLCYHLFGSGSKRFLSPDSSFSEGATFQSIINELEHVKLKKLNDMIYGKRGFDYWIGHYEKKKTEAAKKIKKLEMEYSDFGRSPIVTKNKMSKKGKKELKKQRETNPNQEIDSKHSDLLKPKTDSNKDKRSVVQHNLVFYNEAYKSYVKNLKDLKYQKENALAIQAQYQLQLNKYNQLMGIRWAKYTYKEGVYTFEDSTTFDMLTQEFKFPESEIQENFEIRLLAIPYSSLSKDADEVMLHINMTDAEPEYDARLQIKLEDAFESDQYILKNDLISKNDSVAVKQLFESLLNKKLPLYIKAHGAGVGEWNGYKTVASKNQREEQSYPGRTSEEKRASRMDSTYARLRKSELIVSTKNNITFEVNSYTDPVSSNLTVNNSNINAAIQKYNLSKNQILSAYRTAYILKKTKQELNILASEYMDRESAKIILDRLNSEIDKTKIQVGKTSFKINQLLP
jgi:hypothetical protein